MGCENEILRKWVVSQSESKREREREGVRGK